MGLRLVRDYGGGKRLKSQKYHLCGGQFQTWAWVNFSTKPEKAVYMTQSAKITAHRGIFEASAAWR